MTDYCFRVSIALLYLLFISGCDKDTKPPEKQSFIESYEAPRFTQNEGALKVLMDNSLTSYFIYRGQPMGYEYEMLDLFAKENDLKLHIKIIHNVAGILDSLKAGAGDLAAANLTISKDRMNHVAFSSPLFRTKQVLVQRLPDEKQYMTRDRIEKSLIRDRLDLDNRTITVRKSSSYALMLHNLVSETGLNLNIDFARGDFVTEQLIEMVSKKEIDYTVCDLNKAEMFDAYFDNIDIKTPMSLSQPIAWAVNKGSVGLLSALNLWIEKRKGSMEFNMIHNRYFEMTRRKERLISKEYNYIKEGKISEYDELIKKYASELKWDWRLLAAQIYKESRFDPKSRSWRGAVGLMQLIPRTAETYGVKPDQLVRPGKNIYAGTRHLFMLENYWSASITDSLELLKFTLGSYNVGQGHVEDAIRLAEKYQLDTKKWDDHVAKMLINKSTPEYYKDPVVKYGYCRGREPVNYVKAIFNDYDLYTQFTD